MQQLPPIFTQAQPKNVGIYSLSVVSYRFNKRSEHVAYRHSKSSGWLGHDSDVALKQATIVFFGGHFIFCFSVPLSVSATVNKISRVKQTVANVESKRDELQWDKATGRPPFTPLATPWSKSSASVVGQIDHRAPSSTHKKGQHEACMPCVDAHRLFTASPSDALCYIKKPRRERW